MPSIQIRNVPEGVYNALKARARADRRSIQQEAAWLLEMVLAFRSSLGKSDWSQVDRV